MAENATLVQPASGASGSAVIPAVQYRNAQAAIEWLERALGFVSRCVYPGPEGTVAHAQLTLGTGMVMLSSYTASADWEKWMVQPEDAGGRSTATICIVVPDAAAVYERAKAAGAEVTHPLAAMPYGGRAFNCKDPEGHFWSVGEYNPWA